METTTATATPELKDLSIAQLAGVVYRDWSKQGKGVNFAAKPYLETMTSLEKISDNYIMDTGYSVVAYFLANAGSWKGETAKAVKAELKARLKK